MTFLYLWFGVNSDKVEIFPHSFKELIEIPFIVRGNWHAMRDSVQDV